MIQYESRSGDRGLEVRIRSDRRMPYRAVEPILLSCARARSLERHVRRGGVRQPLIL